ncbi:predicted protein, partial [Nematostella vectensis]
PTGTKLGPWLFTIMINDLSITEVDLWKYVDDTTITEAIHKGQTSSNLQHLVDDLGNQVASDKFELNKAKCKELRISFARSPPVFDPIMVNDTELECVSQAKILGVTFLSDLKWNAHVDEVIKKQQIWSHVRSVRLE